jgi:hypothetical protein
MTDLLDLNITVLFMTDLLDLNNTVLFMTDLLRVKYYSFIYD